jgi:uncharacterized membrane protein
VVSRDASEAFSDGLIADASEAFSDGLIAIIITIMVLELRVPHNPAFDALMQLLQGLGGYVISFIYVGIYWNKLQYGCSPHSCRST